MSVSYTILIAFLVAFLLEKLVSVFFFHLALISVGNPINPKQEISYNFNKYLIVIILSLFDKIIL